MPRFEQYLADELALARGCRIRPLHGGVAFFFGTAAVAQRVCLWSRFTRKRHAGYQGVNAGDASLLYEGIRRIPWHYRVSFSIAVRAHGMNEELRVTRISLS